jgi:hypothetical protein
LGAVVMGLKFLSHLWGLLSVGGGDNFQRFSAAG